MDMVCDFKTIKLALSEYEEVRPRDGRQPDDPIAKSLDPVGERVIALPSTDPTTEVLAKLFFDYLRDQMVSGRTWSDDAGTSTASRRGVTLERARLGNQHVLGRVQPRRRLTAPTHAPARQRPAASGPAARI